MPKTVARQHGVLPDPDADLIYALLVGELGDPALTRDPPTYDELVARLSPSPAPAEEATDGA
jgi:hypothetical protein